MRLEKEMKFFAMKKSLITINRNFKHLVSLGILGASHPFLFSRRLSYNIKRFFANYLSLVGYYRYPCRIIFLAGMPMSGSTWMKNLLARIPGYYTCDTPMPRDVSYRQDIVDSAFSQVPKYGFTLFKTHLDPTPENLECIFNNGVEKALITYRDFRDVAVARYYRLRDYPKPLHAPDFVDYRSLGKENALNHSIEIVAGEMVPWIREWFEASKRNPERFHFTKFEDLKKDTNEALQGVLDFYDIKLPKEKVEDIIEAAKGRGDMKSNMDAARILPWGYSSTFRSGVVGGWRDELSRGQIKKCKELLGGALIELGYEKDLNW